MKQRWAKSLTAAVLLVCLVAAEAAPATVYAEDAAEDETENETVQTEAVVGEPAETEAQEEADTLPEISEEEVLAEEAKAANTPVALASTTNSDTDDGSTEDTIAEAAPKSVSISDGSIKVTWSKVSGATGYTVYRKASGGSWKKLKDTTSTSYTDKGKEKSLTYNTQYYYTVQAHSSTADSTYGTSTITAAYYKAPSSTTLATTKNGIKVSWKKVSGAGGYGVYRRKSSDSSYKLVKMINSASTLSYKDTDSALESGTKYYYRVQAYKGSASDAEANPKDGRYWGLTASGTSCYYLKAPTLKSATAAASGTKVKWSNVTGATGYAVFRKKGSSGSWKRIATTTKTSYTDTASLKGGKTYYYTVRAYRSTEKKALKNTYNPTYWSYRDGTGVKSVYLKKVSVDGAVKKSSGVKVTWSSVSGASGYGVFRKKGSSGSWTLLGTTTKTSYTDKSSLTKNKTYYYQVRAYKGSKSKAKADLTNAAYWGLYDSSGFAYSTATLGAAMDAKAQQYSSNTNYLILVNCTTNRMAIYTGKKGSWTRKYFWKCSTGKPSTPSKKGQFTTGDKGKSFGTSTYTCWYWTRWSGNYLMHSVLYYPGSMTRIKYGKLGANLSHGCIRLDINNAKWIYDHIPRGTKVVTY